MTEHVEPAPAAKPHDHTYGGPLIRLAALVVDGLLLTVLVFGGIFIVGAAVAIALDVTDPVTLGEDAESFSGFDGVVPGLIVYVVSGLFALAWLAVWQSRTGASPGMKLLRLRVVGPDGDANPSGRAALLRNLPISLGSGASDVTGIVAVDIAIGVVGLLVYLAIGVTISNSPTRQGFHDHLAGGTFVRLRG